MTTYEKAEMVSLMFKLMMFRNDTTPRGQFRVQDDGVYINMKEPKPRKTRKCK